MLALAIGACAQPALSDETGKKVPAPAVDISAGAASKTETAILAGGCFWGLEGVFEHVKGVHSVRSGYSGGAKKTANYEEVSGGSSGHAESVEIVFDPSVVSYGQLLQIYFSVATDPTQLNRQGPDTGTQYRSNIFYTNADQARVAKAYVAQLTASKTFAHPIVTRIDPLKAFYPAEDYHQNYLDLNPTQGYIVYNDLPKVENLKRLFPGIYEEKSAS